MTKKIDKDKDILSIEIECPFCKEKDFDLIGLKSHFLAGDCEVFENTSHLPRIKW